MYNKEKVLRMQMDLVKNNEMMESAINSVLSDIVSNISEDEITENDGDIVYLLEQEYSDEILEVIYMSCGYEYFIENKYKKFNERVLDKALITIKSRF